MQTTICFSVNQDKKMQLSSFKTLIFLQGKMTLSTRQAKQTEESVVRKLMLDLWNQTIFSNIKGRLQNSAMKLVHNERNGEAFDSQLVIGVRESYVNLCSNPGDKLMIYR